MSGGKGGSQSTEVTIPPFIEAAAKENLRRAQKTAGMGYLPYYGPEVAAFSPLQEQAMRTTGGAAEAFGLAGPGFNPLAGMPRADYYDGGLRGYGSGGLLEESLGELATRSPTQFAAYRNLPTLTPPVAGEPPAPRNGGVLPGGREGVEGYPFGNPLLPGGGFDFNGYSPVFSGQIDLFDPELSSAAGGRGISPQMQALQEQIDQLRTQPAFDPSGINERIAGLEGRIGSNQFDPSGINERIAGLENRFGNQFDPSGLQERLAGVESQLGGYQPFDPSELQAQIASLRERPTFDPTGLQGQISGLEQRLGGMNQFDPSGLQAQIEANQQRLANIGQFDPSGLQSQISGLEQRLGGMNQFDPSGLQQRLSGLESQIGAFQQFDPSGLAGQIAALQQQVAGLQQGGTMYGGIKPLPTALGSVKGGGN